MTAEHWRPVLDFPEFEVSNLGRARLSSSKQLFNVPMNTNGYHRFRISRSGKESRKYLHTAVCEAFNGPRLEGTECRHLNGDPLDNRATNLAWGTHSENMRDCVRHGAHREASKTRCHRGHAFDAENTYVNAGGFRKCRACQREHQRRYKAKLRDQRIRAERAVPVVGR